MGRRRRTPNLTDEEWQAQLLRERREKHRRVMAEYRAQHPERTSAAIAKWKAAHVEQVRETNRRWKRKNPARVKELQAGYRFRRKARRPVVGLAKNPLYAAVSAAIPLGLPKHVWDEAVSSLVLAVLEGKVAPADIRKAAARFVTAAWGPHFASLDEIVPGTDGLKLSDLISNETEHF